MIKLEIIDLEKVLKFLIDLPEDIADVAVEDVNDFLGRRYCIRLTERSYVEGRSCRPNLNTRTELQKR